MSELKLEQIGHPDAVSNSLTFDSDGSITSNGTLNLENIKHPDSVSNNISVDSSGRVGIGTATPNKSIEIFDSANTQLRVRNGANDAQSYDLGRNGSDGIFQIYGNQTGFTGYSFGGVDGERMRIDSAGRVTMPYQPMCFVTRISQQAVSNDADNPTDLVLNSPIYNVGNHFNDSNSRWTAPVTGYYEFSWSYGTNIGSASVYRTFLWKNGSKMNETQLRNDSSGTTGYTFGSRTAIVQMNTNDYVVLRASTDSGANFYGDSQLRIVLTVKLIG